MASDSSGLTAIAERYATALYELAEDEKLLDKVAQDLRDIKAMIGGSESLNRFIRSPLLDRRTQSAGILAILEAAGIQDLTRRFIGIVARNRRLFAVPAMIEKYLGMLAERRGEVTAHVLSPARLTEEQIEALTDTLAKKIGGKVIVDVEIDTDLIGGLVVRVGSRMFDSSIRTKLQRMQLAMKGAA